MLQLTTQDIKLGQAQNDKLDAIRAIAADLTDNGYVADGYVEGMLNREGQNSTFLGNGIAIPHGTTDTRDLVHSTGVAIHHFPAGVDWADGNTVYVAIGIAAKSDEHLGILKQLTKVLASDGVEESLKAAKTEKDIIAILNGDVQFEADLDASLVQVQFPANDIVQLSAVAGGLLKNKGNANADFVADLVTKAPTSLGNGLWLVSSNKGVTRTGLSFVSTNADCQIDGQAVKALIAVAGCNSAHQGLMANISSLVFKQQQADLVSADSAQSVVALLNGEEVSAESGDDNTQIFVIKNGHGLHARPGAMLVAEAKKFESTIKVVNLDGDGRSVNAKSLMKVIALGVKKGHQLQFTAEGADAAEALAAIGAAIESGLGES
ncbi:fused PTS fructose transporter subunit IIA/HPr protein [Vibrio palustris]|uniref:Multiphosphoryl transfer protein n=1 Tax=Vibrio palustris TaxID=1918946 RepID=A0A1R4B4U2_9VIBR|nr:fused PTS fructose transporter subunit IIA/HPr protein [Vibrio palustris]SJL83930.1 Multiphosphoryl transfer protein [Vibrio palustris]